MPTLQKISLFLRNLLVQQHLYFLCCASCGEIKTPLKSRLCASLPFSFPVDAVILEPEWEKALEAVQSLDKYAPWLKHIYIIVQQDNLKHTQNERIKIIQATSLGTSTPYGLASTCHSIPDLNEYFLLVPAGEQLKEPCLPLDFFTPNGIPLLRLVQETEGKDIFKGYTLAANIFGQTKESVTTFWEQAEITSLGSSAYYEAYAKWAFDAGQAIPAKG